MAGISVFTRNTLIIKQPMVIYSHVQTEANERYPLRYVTFCGARH